LYRIKHLIGDGEIEPVHIAGAISAADKCTKVTVGNDFSYKTAIIQGHSLVQGKLIPGVIENMSALKEKKEQMILKDE
jgi:hypothetical protein